MYTETSGNRNPRRTADAAAIVSSSTAQRAQRQPRKKPVAVLSVHPHQEKSSPRNAIQAATHENAKTPAAAHSTRARSDRATANRTKSGKSDHATGFFRGWR